jgi:hypothetical protein
MDNMIANPIEKVIAMTTQQEPSKRRFEIRKLEERIAPGTLAVSPPNSISDGTSNTITDAAKPGLQTAEEHSGGVVTWLPGG